LIIKKRGVMMAEKKSTNEKLQEKIFMKKKSAWLTYSKNKVFDFCEDYKNFLAKNKTERLCVQYLIKNLEKKKFKEISQVKKIKPGDKVYKNIKNKAVIAAIIGKDKSFNLVGSHLDSPRLDLKPNPIYEDSNLALMQTHYYGGIKKYHWVNTPLELHGIIFTKNKKINLSIGSGKNEPKFMIPDLLPHLAKKQMERKGNQVIEGEELNILVGNIPVDDAKIKDQIKFTVMKELNKKYGITEEDFVCAELELVPYGEPVDVGLDRGLIGAYGQDDKVCAYTSLQAFLKLNKPKTTAVAMFADKEEIGSMGDTGASSFMLNSFTKEIINKAGWKTNSLLLLEKSKAVSADVTAGMNPSYKDVNDPSNVSYLGKGVSIEKYGGGGGKYSTHDASAEYMAEIRNILDKEKIPWQTGELGKIDLGGGGTIAMFLSRYGMDCLDAGPCVLGMHSPYEVTSKVDVYSSYLFYKAFWET